MRFVMIDDRYHMAYGAQLQAIQVARQFMRNGHDALFVTTSEGVLADRARSEGLEVLVIPAPAPWLAFERKSLGSGVVSRARSTITMINYSRTVAGELRSFRPDLVMVSNVRSSLILFWHRLTRRAPVVLYAQNNTPMGQYAAVSALISQRFGMIGPSCLETFPSWIRSRVRRRSFPLPGGRDLDRYVRVEEQAWSEERPPNVLSIASLTERKGLHWLIEAVAQIRAEGIPATLTIVGGADGDVGERYAERLEVLANDLGVPTDFAGWQDDVRPYLERSNLFALASSNEGLPGVLIEAMASGRACVTSRAGNAGTLIDDACGGISVDIGDVDGLARAMRDLLGDAERRSQCASNGHAYVHAELGLDRMYRDLEAGLSDLVSFET